MGRDLELCIAADRLDSPLERGVGEGRVTTAQFADQMMVVVLGVDSLVARSVTADLHAMDEVKLVELLEGAVDACPPD